MTDRQNTERLILVVGATGNQGGAVARSLLDRGFRVRGLTRNPQKPEAQALTEQGAEVVQGDMEDRSAMERVLEGAYGVFSVQNFWEAGYDREVKRGKTVANAAKAAGVEHFDAGLRSEREAWHSDEMRLGLRGQTTQRASSGSRTGQEPMWLGAAARDARIAAGKSWGLMMCATIIQSWYYSTSSITSSSSSTVGLVRSKRRPPTLILVGTVGSKDNSIHAKRLPDSTSLCQSQMTTCGSKRPRSSSNTSRVVHATSALGRRTLRVAAIVSL